MSTISIIAAVAENDAIGRENRLLWHMPADMKRFKTLTTGHTVVMGRRTFESLPKGALPNRKNIVLTSRVADNFPECIVCGSMSEALEACGKGEDEVFIIGGATVYREAMDIADKIYLTRIHAVAEDADAFFPEVSPDEWEETERQEFSSDDRHAYPFTFITYQRRR